MFKWWRFNVYFVSTVKTASFPSKLSEIRPNSFVLNLFVFEQASIAHRVMHPYFVCVCNHARVTAIVLRTRSGRAPRANVILYTSMKIAITFFAADGFLRILDMLFYITWSIIGVNFSTIYFFSTKLSFLAYFYPSN